MCNLVDRAFHVRCGSWMTKIPCCDGLDLLEQMNTVPMEIHTRTVPATCKDRSCTLSSSLPVNGNFLGGRCTEGNIAEIIITLHPVGPDLPADAGSHNPSGENFGWDENI